MKVRVVRAFGSYRRGPMVFDWPDGAARLLIASGFLVEAKDDAERATAKGEPERADMKYGKKARKPQ